MPKRAETLVREELGVWATQCVRVSTRSLSRTDMRHP